MLYHVFASGIAYAVVHGIDQLLDDPQALHRNHTHTFLDRMRTLCRKAILQNCPTALHRHLLRNIPIGILLDMFVPSLGFSGPVFTAMRVTLLAGAFGRIRPAHPLRAEPELLIHAPAQTIDIGAILREKIQAEVKLMRDLTDMRRVEVQPTNTTEDPILSKWICPITCEAIMYPLVDPRDNKIYEAYAILEWVLTKRANSPLTREALSYEDLEKPLGVKTLIEHRLNFLKRANTKRISPADITTVTNYSTARLMVFHETLSTRSDPLRRQGPLLEGFIKITQERIDAPLLFAENAPELDEHRYATEVLAIRKATHGSKFATIPELFKQDPVLNRWRCPILLETEDDSAVYFECEKSPIRTPQRIRGNDKTAVVYDEDHLVKWIITYPSFPPPKWPEDVPYTSMGDNLYLDKDLLAKIDTRLEELRIACLKAMEELELGA